MSHIVTFRLDADTLALLDSAAKLDGKSRSEVVRACVRLLLVSRLPKAKPIMRVKYAPPLSKRQRVYVGLPALPNEGR